MNNTMVSLQYSSFSIYRYLLSVPDVLTSYNLFWLFYSQNNESTLFVLIHIYLSPFDYIEITTLLVWVSPKDCIHTVFEMKTA